MQLTRNDHAFNPKETDDARPLRLRDTDDDGWRAGHARAASVAHADANPHADAPTAAATGSERRHVTMDPVHIYWLMMATVALPCAIGSVAARLVLAVFAGAVVALWAGFPLQVAYLALHLFAFAAIRGCRTDWGKLAVALFLPLGIADYYAVTGRITDAQWWWAVYVLAMAQAAILPMTVRPQAFRDAWARLTAKGRGEVLRFAV